MSLLETTRWSGRINVGGWGDGGAGVMAVREPATGDELGMLGLASVDDAYRAAEMAGLAQRRWWAERPEVRADILRRAASLFAEHASEIEDWVVRESGGTRAKARVEVRTAVLECREAAALPSSPLGHVLPTNKARWSFSRRRPAGVVSVIAPFNFPLVLSIRSVAPALALGNAVLLKPDPRTSVSGGVVLQRVFEEAGVPDGVLSLLPGGTDVGEAVVTAPQVRIVSFTGSTAAGRRVGETAARLLKRAHLELGGNNALVVLPGADIPRAASAGAHGSFLHQGQICQSAGRHLVHESLLDDYIAELAARADRLVMGDPATSDVQLGPIIDERQLGRVDTIVRSTIDAGAELAAGGSYSGLFYRPTVLTGLTSGMSAWDEEIFGPVAPVLSFSSIDQAIELVNDSEYGLSVGILGDAGSAMALADRVESGVVHINEQTVGDEPNAPFGGLGASGTGSRFGGAEANFEAFTETQWVTMRPDIERYAW